MSRNYPEGPYYVVADDALDCPPHANSGLALVDTGRSGDWPVARLCEWHMAERIVLTLTCHDDLLAALKEVSLLINAGSMDHFHGEPWIDHVRAAIDKAEPQGSQS